MLREQKLENINLGNNITFKFWTEKTTGRCKCVLINQTTNVEVDLGQYIPGFKFKPSNQFGYKPLSGEIYFSPEELKRNPKEIFAVFHEIGHAKLHADKEIFKIICLLPLMVAYAERNKNLKSAEKVLREEKNAWAVAFNLLRDLRRQGIDLIKLIEDKKEIRNWIDKNGLGSYQEFVEVLKKRKEQKK